MEKLFKLINEIGKISKDKTNPFYKSSYFDINTLMEHLKPLLEKYKLLLIQPLSNVDGRPAITTTILDIEKDIEKEENDIMFSSTMTLPDLQDPQKMGSAITYFRRYALQSALCLQADDDDANYASGKNKETKKDLPGINTGEDRL